MPKKTQSKKNSKDKKSILGQNAIFTPDVINDIHIKSELGRYRMRLLIFLYVSVQQFHT